MGLFGKKPVKEIQSVAWGHMVNEYKIDVDMLSKDFRAVEKPGVVQGKGKVTMMRLFKLSDAYAKNVNVTGWETFDEHPELVLYEGYVTPNNEARLEPPKKNRQADANNTG